MKVSIKNHILSYLTKINETMDQPIFRTSDIQRLSDKGEIRYGKMLGSPSTYEREYRRLRQDGVIEVKEIQRLPGQRQASWLLINII
tara:strand:- start:396 stop:656 length:261 start_codon:yes stop_codon:yes gene_type:complete